MATADRACTSCEASQDALFSADKNGPRLGNYFHVVVIVVYHECCCGDGERFFVILVNPRVSSPLIS